MLGLLNMATKPVSRLTDSQLAEAGEAIAGGNAGAVVNLIKVLSGVRPNMTIKELLGTPEAEQVLNWARERLEQKTSEQKTSLFCRCPSCDFGFETEA